MNRVPVSFAKSADELLRNPAIPSNGRSPCNEGSAYRGILARAWAYRTVGWYVAIRELKNSDMREGLIIEVFITRS